ncbi:hypothetical protein BASA81_007443 [Batrachochytrium salamandrivorans]|nr:hypothetical protein BASA81_007443 [Batrachochytrium salamandrivorans]
MRRRSSLDDTQLKLLQQQHQQQPDLEEFKPSKTFVKPTNYHAWLKSMTIHLVFGIGLAVAICSLHHVIVLFQSVPDPAPMLLQQPARDVLAKCLENVTSCDKIPLDRFRLEWPDRFLSSSSYHQVHDSNPLCTNLCEFLFEKSTTTSGIRSLDSMHKLTQACQLGCQYASREFTSLGQTNCQFDCKNTVWVRFPQRQQCNYHNGLGLATVEFERRFGEGVFGTGKACEAGCILGNSRPCPQCDWDHRLSA